MYDVIIVGAGPAGGSSAYYLAKGGAKVLLLEKVKLPRFKPCAGGISMKFLSSLPFDAKPAIRGKVTRVRYLLNMQDPYDVDLTLDMAMLNRQEFDHLVVREAANLGAEVIDQVQISELLIEANKIKVMTNKGEFEGEYLIGADGVHSGVGKRVGLLKARKIWSAIEVEVPLKHDLETAVLGFGQIRQGYAWSFPKSDRFSVGIGGRGEKRPLDKLMRWLEFLGYKKDRKETKIYSHPLPEAAPGEVLQKGRVLLVGDAAGTVDPLSGEGIRYAVRSAEIASSSILSGDLSLYSRKVYEEITSDFKYAKKFRWLFFHFTKYCYRFGVKNQRISNVLAGIFMGEYSYREFYRQIIKRMVNPFVLAKELKK
jgi:geranylgeranyl reductase family protein